jgi:hypothetical protein
VKAVHDRYYATPPASFDEYRWRLQLIAEETVGRPARQQQAQEDAAWTAAQEMLG